MELSKRLQAVADCVTPGLAVADIGTDHGYIPIYLVQTGISPKAYAMDINRGPLDRAESHIRTYALEDKIHTRLSDGIEALLPMEAECIIIAGMGGGLMIHILDQDRENVRGIREWIFEPQSEVENFRKYLSEHDFQIVKEDMVEEDGKFYPVMKAVRESGKTGDVKDELSYRYGALLLREKHPVLHRYLVREKEMKETIIRSLSGRTGGRIEERKQELEYDLRLIGEALGRYEE